MQTFPFTESLNVRLCFGACFSKTQDYVEISSERHMENEDVETGDLDSRIWTALFSVPGAERAEVS